jgi:hypothetical protein
VGPFSKGDFIYPEILGGAVWQGKVEDMVRERLVLVSLVAVLACAVMAAPASAAIKFEWKVGGKNTGSRRIERT